MRFWQILILVVYCFGISLGFAQIGDPTILSEKPPEEDYVDDYAKVPVEYQKLSIDEMREILAEEGLEEYIDEFKYRYAFRLHITGPTTAGIAETINNLRVGNINLTYFIKSKNASDENPIIIENRWSTLIELNSTNSNTWINTLDKYELIECYPDYIFSPIQEGEQPLELDLWVCQIKSVGDSLSFYLQGDEDITVTVQGYHLPDAVCKESISYTTVYTDEMQSILENDGLEDFAELFTQPYIYKLGMGGPKISYNYSFTSLHFDQTPSVIIGKGDEELEPYGPGFNIGPSPGSEYLFDFDRVTQWQDLTPYGSKGYLTFSFSEDMYYHSGTGCDLWLGFEESLGDQLMHVQLADGLTYISIDAWQVVQNDTMDFMRFGYNPVTKQEFENILIESNVENYQSFLDLPYYYNLNLDSGDDIETAVKFCIELGAAPVATIGKGSGTVKPQAAIGNAITNQHNVNTQEWEDLTSVCDSNVLYSILNDDESTGEAGVLSLWFGFDKEPGHVLKYFNVNNYLLPDSIALNAYRICDKQPITQVIISDSTRFNLDYLQAGDNYYIDSNYYLTSSFDDYYKVVWLQTPSIEKNNTLDSLCSILFKCHSYVYIAYDSRATSPPNWISNDYYHSHRPINSSEGLGFFTLHRKSVDAGERIVLGGNMAEGAIGAESQYLVILSLGSTVPPVADFTHQSKIGAAPLTVQFTDQSTGYIENWYWDFGDGESSIEQSPEHTFAVNDTYNVTLTASNSEGSDSKTYTAYVSDTSPVAAFSADITHGENPMTVTFTDESTGSVDAWLWDFGDGFTSTDQNPVHVYTSVDTFDVTLTASGPDGADQMVKEAFIIVTEPLPVAKFCADVNEGPAPLTIQFSDSSKGPINTWFWDFGDGNNSTDQHPQHVYTKVDTYTVTLIVTGPGGIAKLSKTDYISVQFPTGIAGMSEQPTSFALYGSYPNPFNPTTNITFDVPKAQHVTLSIYNVNGSLVETLVDEHKSPGRYTINWQAGHHSSGTYFIRMVTEGYSKIQKCILLK